MVLVEKPNADDWFNRGVEHMQRNRRYKALLCWEEAISQSPADEGRKEATNNLRTALSLSWGEMSAYHSLSESLLLTRKAHGDELATIEIFNLPGLLGVQKPSDEDVARLRDLSGR